ncbi:proline iminopeptidase-family hydrolase [Solidesulfovibrio magneticus]|uniref:Proline iminopeptidase n=1 Tax=Solidesulfovibrio magneticus (strain ATCC 700980 / DSM 13731 / RS-1) TaxID=573370 RepID=C4XQS3_SOLM1|nr:proline iminopeptidase-family hydrolase [Solidesulfovibrio magneticus]BAH77807.1 proline iminopeptidase [Solidesulfovibrio magneticus RS-1]
MQTQRPASEGLINVPGGRVFYRIVGQDAPGTPLLVVHGGPGLPHDYLEPLEALANARPVVLYDQLGCGRSDRPDDLSLFALPRYVEELDAVRQALGLMQLALLGQSFGALLSVEYLLRRGQEGVERLVLSGPCLSAARFAADQRAYLTAMPQGVQDAVAAAEAAGDYDSDAYQAAMGAFYAKHVCRLDPWPDCLMRAIEGMGLPSYLHLWGPSEFTLTGTLAGYDATPELGTITVPTLLTCGRYDEATPETTADFAGRIPGARLTVIEDASHSHHLEQPARYLETVEAFLA